MIELLAPAGNFECVKAAVQNGSNAIYFGANSFSARAYATNFDTLEIQNTINYCKTRNVKTFLALNTLLKENEFDIAIDIVKNAYVNGIDAIIIQDLGLAQILHDIFPDICLHASTQMSVHNLDGVLQLQKLGFKRVVLSRELSISEIEYICKNSDVEIECFIHGALCLSYSGQCLFSSMIGARSGNRGKCAQPCRLPYSLLEKENPTTTLDAGYLMSPKDLCGIELIPNLINAGVSCLKIEGRMKSPEYVATVTRIYRKYINLAYSNKPYIVSDLDKKELLQVFNRGNFSTGHLDSNANTNLIFKEKPNNMGIYLGTVQRFNNTKGYVTLKLNETIEIGDTISVGNETGTYTISEIMDGNINLKENKIGQIVTIGRIKGDIHINDKIYKISSKSLLKKSKESYDSENIKIPLSCNITIKENTPITLEIQNATDVSIYKDLYIKNVSECIPVEALKRPIDIESIIKQLSKTNNTPYEFKDIHINLDDNLFIPKLSILNDLRRTSLELVDKYVSEKSKRIFNNSDTQVSKSLNSDSNNSNLQNKKISLLLNNLNLDYNYLDLSNIDKLYTPLHYFGNTKYENLLKSLSSKFNIYIYFPTIMKDNYKNIFIDKIKIAINSFNIKGFVISQIGNMQVLNDILHTNISNYEIIANYTFNIINPNSLKTLNELNINTFTVSPELDYDSINNLSKNINLNSELIVYGKIPVMNMNYCFLGKSNKCHKSCTRNCNTKESFYLKDKLNMNFDIKVDNIQTITTVYNSKILSLQSNKYNCDFVRIDILDESIFEINSVISNVKNSTRLEGNNYTNGNVYREI